MLCGPGLGPATVKRAFAGFPTGVTALCRTVDGRPAGMVVSSFVAVSVEPPLVSICLERTSRTWPRLRGAAQLGISVLAQWQAAACRDLAGSADQRFRAVDWVEAVDGAVFLHGAVAWFSCAVERELDAGDHHLVLLRVTAAGFDADRSPLVVHGGRLGGWSALAELLTVGSPLPGVPSAGGPGAVRRGG